MEGGIVVHFDGAIAADHQISLRTAGKTLTHLQSAVDRAYLDVKYGNVWKHARLSSEDYVHTEFLLLRPEDGGFIQKVISAEGADIVRRMRLTVVQALKRAKDAGEIEMNSLGNIIGARKDQTAQGILKPRSYEDLVEKPDKKMLRKYGDKSIAKEFDPIFSQLKNYPKVEEGVVLEANTLEIIFVEDQKETKVSINEHIAHGYHRLISQRDLGSPVIYTGSLRSLDLGNQYQGMRGKFRNLASKKDVNLYIHNQDDIDKLRNYLDKKVIFKIIAVPILEYDSYDPNGGDIYFIDVA